MYEKVDTQESFVPKSQLSKCLLPDFCSLPDPTYFFGFFYRYNKIQRKQSLPNEGSQQILWLKKPTFQRPGLKINDLFIQPWPSPRSFLYATKGLNKTPSVLGETNKYFRLIFCPFLTKNSNLKAGKSDSLFCCCCCCCCCWMNRSCYADSETGRQIWCFNIIRQFV